MSKSPSRMSKKELRAALLQMGYQESDLVGKKRPELREIFLAEPTGRRAEIALDAAEESEDKLVVGAVATDDQSDDSSASPPIPTPSDPTWTQYVLGQFQDDEMDGENPRVEGLRRVAESLVGIVVEEGCDLIAAPNVENGMRACAKAWVVFDVAGNYRKYEALADASPDNVIGEYNIYLSAMADTRAKGRCYRNALKLKRVVAAEEVRGKNEIVGEDSQTATAIQTGQITGVRMIADRLDVSIAKVLSLLEIDHQVLDNGGIDLKSLTKDEAIIVLKKLNDLQTAPEVPENLRRA